MVSYDLFSVSAHFAALTAALFFVWVTYIINKKFSQRDAASTAVCSSSTCVRCRLTDDKSMLRKLRVTLKQFMKTRSIKLKEVGRIITMLEEFNVTDTWVKWTAEENDNSVQTNSSESDSTGNESSTLSHSVWVVKGLDNERVWPFSKLKKIYPSTDILESKDHHCSVLKEFNFVHSDWKGKWKRNTIPSGKWELFPIINQGQVVQENAELCPETMNLITDLGDVVMRDCVYGNVMFSVLHPGSQIEPHCGPCNFRLRCHVPLYTAKNCQLSVGGQTVTWDRGTPLVFNDSYVHSVRYASSSGSWKKSGGTGGIESDRGREGGDDCEGCGFPRVVLIVDLWHPDVTDAECEAIQCLFSTTMLSQYFSSEH